jgi:hypothetical protein
MRPAAPRAEARHSLFARVPGGLRFGDLAFLFPDGDVYGVVHLETAEVQLNPPLDYIVRGRRPGSHRA